eukprot:3194237-Pleurochrysis_carterae.AAC.2
MHWRVLALFCTSAAERMGWIHCCLRAGLRLWQRDTAGLMFSTDYLVLPFATEVRADLPGEMARSPDFTRLLRCCCFTGLFVLSRLVVICATLNAHKDMRVSLGTRGASKGEKRETACSCA